MSNSGQTAWQRGQALMSDVVLPAPAISTRFWEGAQPSKREEQKFKQSAFLYVAHEAVRTVRVLHTTRRPNQVF